MEARSLSGHNGCTLAPGSAASARMAQFHVLQGHSEALRARLAPAFLGTGRPGLGHRLHARLVRSLLESARDSARRKLGRHWTASSGHRSKREIAGDWGPPYGESSPRNAEVGTESRRSSTAVSPRAVSLPCVSHGARDVVPATPRALPGSGLSPVYKYISLYLAYICITSYTRYTIISYGGLVAPGWETLARGRA